MEEKVFTINLRKDGLKAPRWKKSNKASSTVREYLRRHMKVDNIKIGDSINREIWSRGDQKPPTKIKIKAIKTKDGEDNDLVKAEIWGHVFEEEIKEEKPKKKEEKEKKEETKPEKEDRKQVFEKEKTEKIDKELKNQPKKSIDK